MRRREQISSQKRLTEKEKISREIGAIFRQARLRLGMSQAEVAHSVGANVTYISKIEGGKHSTQQSKYLGALVRVLQLTQAERENISKYAYVATEPQATIPPALQVASETYGEAWPELRNGECLAFLSGLPYIKRPSTPQEWLEVFIILRETLEVRR